MALGRTSGSWGIKRYAGALLCVVNYNPSGYLNNDGAKCGTTSYNRGAGAIYCGLGYTHTGSFAILGASMVSGISEDTLVHFPFIRALVPLGLILILGRMWSMEERTYCR